MEHLLRGTVRRGALDPAALAASLAQDSDGFDEEGGEGQARVGPGRVCSLVGG